MTELARVHATGAQPVPGADPRSLIEATGIRVVKNGKLILDQVDIAVSPGEIVTLIGPNGAGKTTLARVVLGLETPAAGTLFRRDGLKLGYVPQRFEFDRSIPLTVARFLTLGVPAGRDAIAAVLAEVGAAELAERQITALSGGEFQRVALARALIRAPDLLVLDEPVQGVDFLGEAQLYRLIGAIRDRRGCGVLLVSHDLHVVMSASDRVVCLNRHVCCHGVPHAVATHPEYRRLFGPAAGAFAVYTHEHDHAHDLSGSVCGEHDHGHDDPN
jgi:zinc transport system ATP-binding protein